MKSFFARTGQSTARLFVAAWGLECRDLAAPMMYRESAGSIVWTCLQPGSRVNISLGDRQLAGLGYAECLSVTLPPWRLPLSELRWGRFVSAEHSLA